MITSTTTRTQYTASGSTTTFAYPFLILDSAHLVVVVTTSGVDSVKTLNTDYTISGVGSASGGNVVFTSAPAAATTVTLYRQVPYTQLVDYVPNSNFPAESHEAALDKLTMEVQQIADLAARSLRYPVSEQIGTNTELAARSARTATLMGFDSNGDPYLYSINPALLTINIAGSVNTGNIVDGAVTAPKLASTLDLSSKTVTLPARSVTAGMLVNNFDCSGFQLLNFKFKDSEVVRRELDSSCVYTSGTAKDVLPSRVGTNLSSSDRVVTGLGAYDGVYTFQGQKNGANWWAKGTSSSIMWDVNTFAYTLYSDIVGAASVLAADLTKTGIVNDPLDADWGISNFVTLDLESSPLTETATKLAVNGQVRATKFVGDGSGLTGLSNQAISVGLLPSTQNLAISGGTARTTNPGGQGGIAFTTNDTGVMYGGYNQAGYFSPDGTAYLGSLRRMIFKMGTLSTVTLISGTSKAITQVTQTEKISDIIANTGITKIVQGPNNIFILAGGAVFACGKNGAGQLGQGDTTNRPYFVGVRIANGSTPAGQSLGVADISVTPAGIGAIPTTDCTVIVKTVSGLVFTWGLNSNGQCGAAVGNKTTPYNDAAWAFNGVGIRQVMTVGLDTWVLTDTFKVYGSGYNSIGSLGCGAGQKTTFTLMTNTDTTIPISWMVAAGTGTAGDRTVFYGVKSVTGTVYACGYGGNLSLAQGASAADSSTLILTDATVGAVAKLWAFGGEGVWAAAVKTSGDFVTWGYNGAGQLGNGTTTNSGVAVTPAACAAEKAATTATVTDVVAGGTTNSNGTTYALFTNGKVYASGLNTAAEKGRGDATAGVNTEGSDSRNFEIMPIPAAIYNMTAISDESGNSASFYGLDASKRLWACGKNTSYQLGLGHALPVYSVNQVRI